MQGETVLLEAMYGADERLFAALRGRRRPGIVSVDLCPTVQVSADTGTTELRAYGRPDDWLDQRAFLIPRDTKR